jgi:hypothetical protein
MIAYFLALFWALINPAINHSNSNTRTEQVTVMDDTDDDGDTGDTGGETGTIPPKPPKP